MFKLIQKATREEIGFAFQLMTPHEEDSITQYNVLNIILFHTSWWFKIPQIIKPKMKWVEFNGKLGGYIDYIQRDYGFSIGGEALHIHYGIQPGSWSSVDKENSDHTKVYFLPWNQDRRIRYDFLNTDGSYYCSANDRSDGRIDFDAIRSAEESVTKIKFSFTENGNPNIATCHLEEWEYAKGTSWCSWLSLVTKNKVYRRLEIKFENETGPRSGSWKGGTMGTSINLEDGESALSAFIRYGTNKKNGDFKNIVKL